MKKSLNDLLNYRLQRSLDSLEDAKILFENEKWNGTINRLYYAAFYAVSAILIKKNIYTKSHSGLKSKFHQEIIHKKELDIGFGKIYDQLFDLRGNGEYNDFVIYTREQIEPYIQRTERFILEIKDIVNR